MGGKGVILQGYMGGILLNINGGGSEELEEPCLTIKTLGSYPFYPRKLDLDLKNRTTPPSHPSILVPPILELKPLHAYLRYEVEVFLFDCVGLLSMLNFISPVNISETKAEAWVQVQGFKPLPSTRISLVRHESRPAKCQCSASREPFFPVICLGRWLSYDSRV
ncbi:hypothetical protein HAX54_039832 [Datura stramonium]|uniref:Uncharacterized protein n=1 Tax=Datura stramonium TaxID=4076 RepID=A0ABS8VNN0_DATST|nr:hypothetical protein [Datura stramonium]